MNCPRCGSENVIIDSVTGVKTKRRGCGGCLFGILLAIISLGHILFIPLHLGSKQQSQPHNEAACQNCGYRWKL